jgi:hypothetical protein
MPAVQQPRVLTVEHEEPVRDAPEDTLQFGECVWGGKGVRYWQKDAVRPNVMPWSAVVQAYEKGKELGYE